MTAFFELSHTEEKIACLFLGMKLFEREIDNRTSRNKYLIHGLKNHRMSPLTKY